MSPDAVHGFSLAIPDSFSVVKSWPTGRTQNGYPMPMIDTLTLPMSRQIAAQRYIDVQLGAPEHSGVLPFWDVSPDVARGKKP